MEYNNGSYMAQYFTVFLFIVCLFSSVQSYILERDVLKYSEKKAVIYLFGENHGDEYPDFDKNQRKKLIKVLSDKKSKKLLCLIEDIDVLYDTHIDIEKRGYGLIEGLIRYLKNLKLPHVFIKNIDVRAVNNVANDFFYWKSIGALFSEEPGYPINEFILTFDDLCSEYETLIGLIKKKSEKNYNNKAINQTMQQNLKKAVKLYRTFLKYLSDFKVNRKGLLHEYAVRLFIQDVITNKKLTKEQLDQLKAFSDDFRQFAKKYPLMTKEEWRKKKKSIINTIVGFLRNNKIRFDKNRSTRNKVYSNTFDLGNHLMDSCAFIDIVDNINKTKKVSVFAGRLHTRSLCTMLLEAGFIRKGKRLNNFYDDDEPLDPSCFNVLA